MENVWEESNDSFFLAAVSFCTPTPSYLYAYESVRRTIYVVRHAM